MISDSTTRRDPQQALAERVRFVASAVLILFLVGWCLWFYPYDDLLDRSGTPLGADYSMFYVAGQTVLEGAADQLYDQAHHQQRLQRLFPNIDPRFALPYRYPPFVAMLMAPLAALPYAVSFAVFLAISCAAWFFGLRMLAGQLGIFAGAHRNLVCLAFAGWPVALETMIGGQASMLGLLILAATVTLMIRRRYAWAGAVLALAAFKPNLLLLFAAGCVLSRPRMLRGLLPAGGLALALCLATAGWTGTIEYLQLSSRLAAGQWLLETPPWKVHGLVPWLSILFAGRARLLVLLLGLLATIGVAWRWRRAAADNAAAVSLSLALLVTINSLANPYAPLYDLSLLAVGVLLTAAGLVVAATEVERRRQLLWSQLLLVAVYFGPHLSQLLARQLGLQLFALVLLAVAAWQARLFWNVTQTAAPATQLSGWASDGSSS